MSAVHRKKRNFVCDECGFAASGKSNLNTHIKAVYKKIKDNACQLCDYKTSMLLQVTNVKSALAEQCGNKELATAVVPYGQDFMSTSNLELA